MFQIDCSSDTCCEPRRTSAANIWKSYVSPCHRRRGPHRTKVQVARQIDFCWGVFSPGLFGRLLASDRLLRGVLQARHLDPARMVSARSLSPSLSMHSPTHLQQRASVAQHTVWWCCVPGKTKNTAQQKNQKRVAIIVITLFIMKPQMNYRDIRYEERENR